MRNILIIALFSLITTAGACSLVDEFSKNKDLFEGWIKDKAQQTTVEFLSKEAPESAKAADIDKSGTTTWDEWKAYILSGGGALALIAEILRRRINSVETSTKDALDVAHARIDRRVRKPDPATPSS